MRSVKRGSVQLMEPVFFDDTKFVELLDAPEGMSLPARQESKSSISTLTSTAAASKEKSESSTKTLFAADADAVENFPVFVTALAASVQELSVVVSSRHDNLKEKQKKKPDDSCFKAGSFSVKMLAQFSEALQTAGYVVLKMQYMLNVYVMNADTLKVGLKKPVKPMMIREFDNADHAEEALRAMHTSTSRLSVVMDDLVNLVAPKKKRGNIFRSSQDKKSFINQFRELQKNDFVKVKRSSSKTKAESERDGVPAMSENSSSGNPFAASEPTKNDFLTAMEQFCALKGHFAAIMLKCATLQRVMDSTSKPVSMGGAMKTLIAVSRFKKLGMKNKGAAKPAAAAEAAKPAAEAAKPAAEEAKPAAA